MLSKLAIWYLRKRKKTVILNVIAKDGSMQQSERSALLYDNCLMDVAYYDYDGNIVTIPEGKFSFEREVKQ